MSHADNQTHPFTVKADQQLQAVAHGLTSCLSSLHEIKTDAEPLAGQIKLKPVT